MIENLEQQLRRDEGEVLHAYEDSLGYLSIGIGRLIDKRKGGGISHEESSFLFQNDLVARRRGLETWISWFHRIDPVRQGVLLNMSFQLGVEGLLKFRVMLACLREGDYKGAAAAMLKSVWAEEQTPERAMRLAEQMRTGVWV